MMAVQTERLRDRPRIPTVQVRTPLGDAAKQARAILRMGFVAAPILAGADKFFDLMTDWEDYLAPEVVRRSPVKAHTLMRAAGAVEIAAGLLVAAKPKWGGAVVAAWLAGIIGNLALRRRAWDIALRDLGLMLGAVALTRLSAVRE